MSLDVIFHNSGQNSQPMIKIDIFQNFNPFLNCLDTIHIQLTSFVHAT